MIVPRVFARVEQRSHRSGIGIYAREIGPFVRIASIAGERETGRIVGTAVLFRHDVLDVEGNQRRCQLGKAAILTCVPGPRAHKTTSYPVQSGSLPREDATGLCLHYGNDIDGLDKVFVLGILGGCERSVIRLAAQLFDSRLQIRVCTKVKKSRGGFRRQRFG
jgi:hypothetical protein